jgi:hypothetical protein
MDACPELGIESDTGIIYDFQPDFQTEFDISSGFDAGQYSLVELLFYFCIGINFDANKE